MSEEICHVCKKVKKPYVVFLKSDIMSLIQHDMAREDGPICERCNNYYAMTMVFKDATDEEFELARNACRFSREMLEWWTKDKKLGGEDNYGHKDCGYFDDTDGDPRDWAGTHDLVKWYIEHYGKEGKDGI